MLAYWVHNLDPFAFEFANGYGVRWYGLAYLAAFAAAYLVYRVLANRGFSVIPTAQVGDFVTGCAVFGVLLGGRLGYLLLYDFPAFARDPLMFVRLWEGGMSAHGGIIGVTLYTLWYAWRQKVNWPGLGDNLVVGAPLGLFLGRVANFMNGELYGRPSEVPWAIQFPKELFDLSPEVQRDVLQRAQEMTGTPIDLGSVISDGARYRDLLAGALTPRHPSQIYEACLEGLVLFVALWLVRTRCRVPNGVVTGLFFTGYALLRIAGEFFREPDASLILTMTRGQFFSIFLVLIGVGFLVAAWLRPSYPPAWSQKMVNK